MREESSVNPWTTCSLDYSSSKVLADLECRVQSVYADLDIIIQAYICAEGLYGRAGATRMLFACKDTQTGQ